MSTEQNDASIRDWFATWGRFVAAVDFAGARDLFDTDVIGFGTFMDTVTGLDNLEQRQWRSIWPTIRDFRFNLDSLKSVVSDDRLLAVAAITWSSTGIGEDGTPFDRPGRATVGLVRTAPNAPWRGMHTHFSLNPGTPQTSYGDRHTV